MVGIFQYLASSRAVNAATASVINTVPPDRGKLITLIAGSNKRQSLLTAGDDDKVFVTRSLNVIFLIPTRTRF